jgi:uncharacterized membrane protein
VRWTRERIGYLLFGVGTGALADGIFHVAFLLVLLAGAALIGGRRLERRTFAGLLLVGWGLFHAIDQLVFHLALGAHHIREEAEHRELYDWGFFAIGIGLIAAGAVIARRDRVRAT